LRNKEVGAQKQKKATTSTTLPYFSSFKEQRGKIKKKHILQIVGSTKLHWLDKNNIAILLSFESHVLGVR
jgi:hypothetical protein